MFWYDLDADNIEDERTFHAGLPVKKGIKVGAAVEDGVYRPLTLDSLLV